MKGGLTHTTNNVASEATLVRVSSDAGGSRERYQGILSTKFLRGLVRPFGSADVRYTERDSIGLEDDYLSTRVNSGVLLTDDSWNVREAVEVWNVNLRGDSYAGAAKDAGGSRDEWADSLRQVRWNQSAELHLKGIDLSHFLQYEHRDLAQEGDEDSWVGDLNALPRSRLIRQSTRRWRRVRVTCATIA